MYYYVLAAESTAAHVSDFVNAVPAVNVAGDIDVGLMA